MLEHLIVPDQVNPILKQSIHQRDQKWQNFDVLGQFFFLNSYCNIFAPLFYFNNNFVKKIQIASKRNKELLVNNWL